MTTTTTLVAFSDIFLRFLVLVPVTHRSSDDDGTEIYVMELSADIDLVE